MNVTQRRQQTDRATIICLGPTGIGYYGDVSEVPTVDRGVIATHHGALLVCDAGIVALLAAADHPGRVHLVTNNLGSVDHEAQTIRAKLGADVVIHPDPAPFRGAPIDLVLVDRGRGTRSYVTSNYFPSASHISTATRAIRSELSAASPVVLYVDVEISSDSGRDALDSAPALAAGTSSLWNVGQAVKLTDVVDWLSGTALPANAILQASLGDSRVTADELLYIHRRISSVGGVTLIVTLGRNGAAWTDGRTTHAIAVDPVSAAFTLGAGAVLAGSLVIALANPGRPGVATMISGAVAQATRYVHDATVDHDLHGLAYW